MKDFLLVMATVPSSDVGRELAKALLNERLCACANLIPSIHSVYWWKGSIEETPETMLFMKTTRDKSSELCRRIVELHPYEVPEALVVEVSSGHPDYLQWVVKETD